MTVVIDEAANFAAWERQISTAGGCSHPIRLRGKVTAVDLATGEARTSYDTASEPGGVLHVACGNRRASVCPACSAVYKRDARQLIRAGLVGGKGLPATVTEHPCVFATFTAPSFGPVHARRERNGQVLLCRPRRDRKQRVCPHGRDISCNRRHAPDDPCLGRPMCPDCFDYESAVVFNAEAPKLWRRFTTYLPRVLAKLGGMTQREFRQSCKLRFVKVVEYQARGVIHYHAVIRLDAAVSPLAAVVLDNDILPPSPEWTAELLADAVTAAASAVSVLVDVGNTERTLLLRFGAQTDTRVIRSGTETATSRDAVANYIAKYATKDADVSGLPDHRLRSATDLRQLRCPPHTRRLIETAWDLGYRIWAHQLGRGGHFLTKSRRFSVTFGQLRAARRDHRRAQRHPDGELDPWGRVVDESTVVFIGDWHYAGEGFQAADAHALALMSACAARQR